MPTPTFTTSKSVQTHVHEVTTRTPDYLDWLTIFLPAILPVLTFLAGYRLNRWYEKGKERERLVDIKEYFLTLARDFKNAIYAQANLIQSTIDRLKTLSGNELNVSLVSALRTTRIKAIADIDLYKVFIADTSNIAKRTEQLNEISTQLDFIDDNKGLLNEINKNLHTTTVDFHKNYLNKINKIVLESHNEYYKFKKNPDEYDPHLLELITLVIGIMGPKAIEGKTYSNDIADLHNSLAKPLYDAEGLSEINRNEYTSNLIDLISDLKVDYKNLESHINTLILNLESIATSLNGTGRQMSLILKELT